MSRRGPDLPEGFYDGATPEAVARALLRPSFSSGRRHRSPLPASDAKDSRAERGVDGVRGFTRRSP